MCYPRAHSRIYSVSVCTAVISVPGCKSRTRTCMHPSSRRQARNYSSAPVPSIQGVHANMVLIGGRRRITAWIPRFTANAVKAAVTSCVTVVAVSGLRREILNLAQLPHTAHCVVILLSCVGATATAQHLLLSCALVLPLVLFCGGIGFRKLHSGVEIVVQQF